jgi:hypothetical protein
MTQHADKVEQVRRRNRLGAWRKGIKFMLGQAIDGGKDVMHTTIYNDDAKPLSILNRIAKLKSRLVLIQ